MSTRQTQLDNLFEVQFDGFHCHPAVEVVEIDIDEKVYDNKNRRFYCRKSQD
jgi:hypothetical protein